MRLNKCTRYSLRVNSKRAYNYIQEDMTPLVLMVSPVVFTSPFGESEATVISLISTLFRSCESNCLFISASSLCCWFRSKSSCTKRLRLTWNIARKQQFPQPVIYAQNHQAIESLNSWGCKEPLWTFQVPPLLLKVDDIWGTKNKSVLCLSLQWNVCNNFCKILALS